MRNSGKILKLSPNSLTKDSRFSLDFMKPSSLAAGEVRIRIIYTSLSFKDYIQYENYRFDKISHSYVLGTDAVGTVIESESGYFAIGDRVLCVATNLGTVGPGGMSEFLVAEDKELTKVPDEWTDLQAISLGTPAFTAALCLLKIKKSFTPSSSKILVSGAAGAVGSFAVELAQNFGFNQIDAISSRVESEHRLKDLGATKLINLDFFIKDLPMKLLPEKWDAALDSLGGEVLSNILKGIRRGGSVLSVGRALSDSSIIDLAPFYLRNVSLIGISLENEYVDHKVEILKFLTKHLPTKTLSLGTKVHEIGEIPLLLEKISQGGLGHRCVIEIQNSFN